MMNELSSMPNKIKDIISDKQNETFKELESKFKEFSFEQDFMKRQIKARVEKQALDKYLENIGGVIGKNLKELKAGGDFETGIPITG
jgi:arginyl-tRNA synthetase